MDDPLIDPANRGFGIRRGTVQLSDHDPRWASVGAATVSEIANATGIPADRIQHVGSTSVPGLAAKPILDIVLGVNEPDSIDAVAGQLVSLGYLDRGGSGGRESSIGRLIVRESLPEVRTVHVHVVEHGTEAWRDYVQFRDALRRDLSLRDQYAEVKRTLAQRFPEDRKSYRTAKNAFIRDTLDSLSTGPGEAADELVSFEPLRQQAIEAFFTEAWIDTRFPFDPEGAHSDLRHIPYEYQSEGGEFWLLRVSDRLVGTCAIGSLPDNIAEVKRLVVLPEYRGQGFGDRLLRHALRHAVKAGFGVARLDTIRDRGPAVHLFEKYGFLEIPRYTDNADSDLFMELDLAVWDSNGNS